MSTATTLDFPAVLNRIARLRLDRVELRARHRWLMRHAGEWSTTATNGATYLSPTEQRLHDALDLATPYFGTAPSAKTMRENITAKRRLIRKRNAVKSWLVDLGADPAQFASAEDALFWLFDQATKSTKS